MSDPPVTEPDPSIIQGEHIYEEGVDFLYPPLPDDDETTTQGESHD